MVFRHRDTYISYSFFHFYKKRANIIGFCPCIVDSGLEALAMFYARSLTMIDA
jgi:hypothetical protein